MYERNEKKLKKIMCLIVENFKTIGQKMNPGDFVLHIVLYVTYWYRKTASCDLYFGTYR
jgi:hypothetical protein